mgnify:CR=1 FL=1|tara:strand:+ start:17029 stop:17937 length:909 start_codon:yes stop_codon:yes gene_type:complete
MKIQYLPSAIALILGLFLSGCQQVAVTNLTPAQYPTNPSGTYTISMSAQPHDADALQETIQAYITIDGETYAMRESSLGDYIYDFDYKIPAGQDEASYYFHVNYETRMSKANPHSDPKEMNSGLYHLSLVNRYITSIDSERGPVGATIPVLGRGFTPYDRIYVGATEASTRYESGHAMTFTVPPLAPGQIYPVELRNEQGNLPIGHFRIDASSIKSSQSEIHLEMGESTIVVFKLDFDAPYGGLPISITTDVPSSVVMPEVMIPEGARTVSVPIQGSIPGEGTLFVEATGFDELQIPVSIQG